MSCQVDKFARSSSSPHSLPYDQLLERQIGYAFIVHDVFFWTVARPPKRSLSARSHRRRSTGRVSAYADLAAIFTSDTIGSGVRSKVMGAAFARAILSATKKETSHEGLVDARHRARCGNRPKS